MEPGIVIPNEEYHKDTSRISKSGLDLINKSPAHYYYRYLDPNYVKPKEKEWAATGNALGCAILEPDEFPIRYAFLDDVEICKEIGGARPTSTNKYKEWYEKEAERLKGKIILTPEEYNQTIKMRDSGRAHPAFKTILAQGYSERTFHFTDPFSCSDNSEAAGFVYGNACCIFRKDTGLQGPEIFFLSCFY